MSEPYLGEYAEDLLRVVRSIVVTLGPCKGVSDGDTIARATIANLLVSALEGETVSLNETLKTTITALEDGVNETD